MLPIIEGRPMGNYLVVSLNPQIACKSNLFILKIIKIVNKYFK